MLIAMAIMSYASMLRAALTQDCSAPLLTSATDLRYLDAMTEAVNPNEALDALRAATRRYEETKAVHEAARDAAASAVVTALRAGATPTAVTGASPFTDAYVRKIARENGIAPAKPGIKPGQRNSKRKPTGD